MSDEIAIHSRLILSYKVAKTLKRTTKVVRIVES